MNQELQTAPEVKTAAGGDVSEAFGEFMHAFEAFKEANDERLAEIERKAGPDGLTVEKVDRINQAMDEQKRLIDQLVLKGRRPALGGDRDGGTSSLAAVEHKAAFDAYVRRGAEDGLRALEEKALTVSTNSGADGGYTVPDEVEKEIGRRLASLSPMRAISSVRQISANVYKKAFSTTAAATGWVAETDSRSQTTTPTLAELQFPAMELYAMPAATGTLLDDSAVNIDEWIAGEVEQAFATQEGTAFVNGDGSSKPTGFLHYTKAAEASWAWTKIGYVKTGVAGDFAADGAGFDNLVDLVYTLKSGYRQNATFLMNRATQGAVRKLKDEAGNYIWQPAAVAGGAASLMNFPVAESEDMPDIDTDAYAIAFGDFRQGYLIVDRVGVRVLRDPYSAKPYVLFYTTKRVGGGVQDFDAIKLLKFGTA
jgi:HK97 family phage major capsid protein